MMTAGYGLCVNIYMAIMRRVSATDQSKGVVRTCRDRVEIVFSPQPCIEIARYSTAPLPLPYGGHAEIAGWLCDLCAFLEIPVPNMYNYSFLIEFEMILQTCKTKIQHKTADSNIDTLYGGRTIIVRSP